MANASIDLGRVGLWTGVLDSMPSSAANELCAEASELGFQTIWIPEAVGRDPFVTAMRVLENTSSIKIATGIANIYARDAMTTANAQRSIEEAHPGRFLLGLGVSHLHLVEWVRKHDYSKPLSCMREYLA
ncbi:MAG TPA: LLM class flavin-dependent oxidoreductase, partial [Acidimicrobiales bacterium]|nr:LLM class flavin-dependent oxidoreductase [Acidimicrobiales bacterium]